MKNWIQKTLLSLKTPYGVCGMISFFCLALYNYIFFMVAKEKHSHVSGAENPLGQVFFFISAIFIYLSIVGCCYLILVSLIKRVKNPEYVRGLLAGFHFFYFYVVVIPYAIAAIISLVGSVIHTF